VTILVSSIKVGFDGTPVTLTAVWSHKRRRGGWDLPTARHSRLSAT